MPSDANLVTSGATHSCLRGYHLGRSGSINPAMCAGQPTKAKNDNSVRPEGNWCNALHRVAPNIPVAQRKAAAVWLPMWVLHAGAVHSAVVREEV